MDASPPSVCRTCGAALAASANGIGSLCPVCLLDFALGEETAAEDPPSEHAPPQPSAGANPPAAGRFAHYALSCRDDGTFVELGRGGMGVTYRATDTTLRCAVALKVVNPTFVQDTRVRARFLREAQAAAGLRHPHVASVFFFGERAEDGQLFYAMELVEGETLHARVRRGGGLPAAQVLTIGSQVAEALAAAEARGLTHRDLKPANLMLVEGEMVNVKVIDFGLAKAAAAESVEAAGLTGTQEFVGTPAFASPEHFNVWQEVDARSDFYALGAMLWYALTGHAPFSGRTPQEIRDQQLRAPPSHTRLHAARVPRPVETLLQSLLSPDPAGRPQTARELAAVLAHCQAQIDPSRHRKRVWVSVAAAAVCVVLTWGLLRGERRVHSLSPPAALATSEKSLAVLPFDNFGEDKDGAVFAEGVQDEVLTDLAKIADLKVISRSSVMQYKDPGHRNLPDIGKALGVAYVVEGSVQRAGNKIRVTAQLIDARTDAHQWAEHYDRDLADVFAIQSDIAQAIAGQLQANVSPQAHAAITEAPTHNLQAYELYLRALQLFGGSTGTDVHAWIDQIVGLLTEATRLDPDFARAYVFLAETLGFEYVELDRTPALAARVRGPVDTVLRLRPGSSDAHEAAAAYAFLIENDYARARDEYFQTVRLAPNDAKAFHLLGCAERFLGLWEDCLAHLHKAMELDPQDQSGPLDYIETLRELRRYPETMVALDHLAAMHPRDAVLSARVQIGKARTLLAWKADPVGALALLANLPKGFDPNGAITSRRLFLEYCARDFAAANRDLAACTLPEIADLPRALYEGYNARYRGDAATAEKAFLACRPSLADRVSAAPADEATLMQLATVDAALGRKADALTEARRAAAMYPLGKDAWVGPRAAGDLAVVLAWTGEIEEAVALIQALCAGPCGPSYGYLKLHPDWDPLRGDPRFEAAVASLAPKP